MSVMAALIPALASALDIPDTIGVKLARCFADVIEAGDTLCISHINIEYDTSTVASIDTVTTNYIIRLMQSNTELMSVVPPIYPGTLSNANKEPAKGYGENLVSHYLDAATVVATGITPGATNLSIRVESNPFADPPTDVTGAEQSALWTTTRIDLFVMERIDTIVTQWNLSQSTDIALTESISGRQVLTAIGESYMALAIPNLSLMAPIIYTSSVNPPSVSSGTGSTSTQTDLEDIWEGSALENAFDALSTLFPGVPKMLSRTIILTLVLIAMSGFVKMVTGEVPGSNAFVFVSMIGVGLPGGTLLGLAPLALAFIVVASLVVTAGYKIFMR